MLFHAADKLLGAYHLELQVVAKDPPDERPIHCVINHREVLKEKGQGVLVYYCTTISFVVGVNEDGAWLDLYALYSVFGLS